MRPNTTIDLDFIKQPFWSVSNLSWSGVLSLLFAFVIAGFAWQFYNGQQSRLINVTSQLEQLSKQAKPALFSPSVTAISIEPKEIQQIQQVVSILTAPWSELLTSIEQADMQNIVLLSLTPNLKKQQITLTGEAKDLASVLQYVKQLETQPMLSQVYLQKHTVDVVNAVKPVSFSINAQWKKLK